MLYIKNISKLNLRNIFFQMWADQKFIWLGVWFVFSNVSKGETSVTHFHFIQTDKLRELSPVSQNCSNTFHQNLLISCFLC